MYYIWPVLIAAALALGILLGGKLNFNDSPERLFTTNSKISALRLFASMLNRHKNSTNNELVNNDDPTI